MTTYKAGVVVDGLAFPEAPRWYRRRFWFTDQHARVVYSMSTDGSLEEITTTSDRPGGLGWLPDGRLLVIYMTERRVMQLAAGLLVEYADLSNHASFHCNDMVIDSKGRAYVGNFGFDLHGGAPVRNAELVLVDTDGSVEILTDSMVFPNGCVITPDGKNLICAETFANRITTIRLNARGRLSGQETWADLDEVTPDGICLDEAGAIWVASPGTRQVIRVQQGGDILARCETLGTPYACMLGGEDRRTLYLCTAETDDPATAAQMKSGRIEQVDVDVPGAGLP